MRLSCDFGLDLGDELMRETTTTTTTTATTTNKAAADLLESMHRFISTRQTFTTAIRYASDTWQKSCISPLSPVSIIPEISRRYFSIIVHTGSYLYYRWVWCDAMPLEHQMLCLLNTRYYASRTPDATLLEHQVPGIWQYYCTAVL